MPISPVVRQICVATSPILAALSVGGAVGYPAALLQQLRGNGSEISLNLDTASWIGSIHGLAGVPSIFMPTIMQWRGRKFAFIMSCLLIITGWILAYFASTILQIYVSECFHGLGTNSVLAVSMLSMGEMVSPKYRNISLVSFSLIQNLGMALVGVMARYIYWKSISIIMCIPVILASVIACTWPESPSWLAYKGKFDKCKQAFELLRGTDDLSQEELKDLIDSQKKNLPNTRWYILFWKTIRRRDFYLPSLHMFVLLNMMYWSGVMVIIVYSIEMIEKVTLNEHAAFIGGISINCVFFVGAAITCVLIRRFNNKPVLLLSALGTAICLLCASIVTFLQSKEYLPKDSLICLYILIVYIICCSLGVSSIVFTIAAELMPVKHRGIGGSLYVIYTCILHATSLKISPYLFEYINMSGTFLVYTINAIVCGLFIWKYVPETKNRTLQQIEEFYTHGQFVRIRVGDESEMKVFIKS